MGNQENADGTPGRAPDPWHIRPGESSLAYRFLYKYLWMGSSRSLAKLARQENRGRSDRPDAGLTQLKKWSVRWDWQARAAAYDAEQLRLDTVYREREKVVDAVLMRAVNNALAVLAEADPSKMTAADAVAVIDKVERLERTRQSRDQPAKKKR